MLRKELFSSRSVCRTLGGNNTFLVGNEEKSLYRIVFINSCKVSVEFGEGGRFTSIATMACSKIRLRNMALHQSHVFNYGMVVPITGCLLNQGSHFPRILRNFYLALPYSTWVLSIGGARDDRLGGQIPRKCKQQAKKGYFSEPPCNSA